MVKIAAVRLAWPLRGVHRNFALSGQPAGTTPQALNVRSYDPRTGRACGAQRPGVSRFLDGALSSGNPIQSLGHVVTSSAFSSPSSLNTRSITRFAVAGGTVAAFDDSAFTVATAGAGALSATAPVIHAAELFGVVYFADGTSQKKWTASSNTVSSITASAGSFPSNGAHRPRLVEMWRGRLVWSGLFGDEHNWFMSKAGDGLDYDYADNTPIAAVAGNATPNVGRLDDVCTAMVPWTEENFVFGCDHSISMAFGDLAAGGSIQRISNEVGMAWGRPWCIDPFGNLWFFGSRGGVYRMAAGGGRPERVTAQSIDEDLAELDMANTLVRLAWDDRSQSVLVFLTQLDGEEATHWDLDTRNQGWWPFSFGDADLNPVAVHLFDGDDPSDRMILLGCRDSRVRFIDYGAHTDDGSAIGSECWLGPMRAKTMQAMILRELQGTLVEAEDCAVEWEVYAGHSEANALGKAFPVAAGRWEAGRNPSVQRGGRGDCLFVRVAGCSCQPWALERIDARLEVLGLEAQRSL